MSSVSSWAWGGVRLSAMVLVGLTVVTEFIPGVAGVVTFIILMMFWPVFELTGLYLYDKYRARQQG